MLNSNRRGQRPLGYHSRRLDTHGVTSGLASSANIRCTGWQVSNDRQTLDAWFEVEGGLWRLTYGSVLNSAFARFSGVVRFSTFATVSANNGSQFAGARVHTMVVATFARARSSR
jgi:hypothetical protein